MGEKRHSYERLAIIRWLQEHNTSPKTGAVLPDRDVRPNHGLRAQIADFRTKHGMEPLPEWKPDAVETIQSIMPQENPLSGAGGHPGMMMGPPAGMMQGGGGGGGGTIQVPVQGAGRAAGGAGRPRTLPTSQYSCRGRPCRSLRHAHAC